MDTLKPRPCPIERLVNHSEEHFIDRRSEGAPVDETFEQLAARRAGNLDLMVRYLETLAVQAPNSEARNPVDAAINHLNNARRHLRSAVAGR